MTTTTTTADQLHHLNFTLTIPCEHSWHFRTHEDEPASFFMRLKCPTCGAGAAYPICASGVRRLSQARLQHTGHCEAIAPFAQWLVSLSPIV